MNRYILVLIAIASFACSESKAPKSLSAYTVGTIQLPLSQDFVPDITRNQYIDSDSGEYLVIKNKALNSINFFSLSSKKIVNEIKLNVEGPNGVGLTNGFRIISQDCLFVASIPPKIQILNFDGKKINSITVSNSANPVNYLSSNNEIPFLLDRNFIFGAQPFFRNIYNTTSKDLLTSKHVFRINLNNEKPTAEWLEVYRPQDEWEFGKKSLEFTWTDRFDSIIVSPRLDHRLWVISKSKGLLLEYKDAKSSSINSFMIIKDTFAGDQGIIESLESDRCELIQYDRYRDVFYRFFIIGIDLENYAFTPRQLFSNQPKIGVLILDGNLNAIGEHIFPDHYAQTWNYFVGRKGLYVSTNNPNRDDFDENVLRYDIIRFEGLKYDE